MLLKSSRRGISLLSVAAVCAAPLALDASSAGASTTSSSTLTETTNDRVTGTTDGTFSYHGSWSTSSGKKRKHLGDDHYSSAAGSSYTYRFSGTSVQLFGALAPHHGQASVQVDGGAATTIDQYAASRRENVLIYTSPALPPGSHVVEVTVKGTKRPAASGTVVAVDRAVATTTTTATTAVPTAPTTTTDSTSPTGQVVFYESGDGADASPYASSTLNAVHSLWHVEGGSAAVTRSGGKIAKVDSGQFHRMFSTRRMGGPGTTLRISYRARATSIHNRPDSSIVEGAKIGLKFPMAESLTGYSKDDPRSVYGKPGSPSSPGSYQFLTGITEGGYLEASRNAYGNGGYTFLSNRRVGYTPGTWLDVVVTVEWLEASAIRIRYWHNATGSGTPVYEVTDSNSPFAGEPGFLWLRTDDTNWEYDFLKVEQV